MDLGISDLEIGWYRYLGMGLHLVDIRPGSGVMLLNRNTQIVVLL